MRTFRTFALALTLAVSAGPGLTAAAARADEASDRFQNQRDRIRQGYNDGSLTRREACRLLAQERDVRQDNRRLARDGTSDRDRRVIERRLDRQSDRIRAERHDNDDADRKGRRLRNLDC